MAEKVSAILTEELLESRAGRAGKGTLKRTLDKVPDRRPLEGDEP